MAQKSVEWQIVDTHAHLFFDHFESDREQIIENARQNGVAAIINVGIDEKTSYQVVEMAQRYDSLYAAVGLHPNDSHLADGNYLNLLTKLAQNKNVVAIGEIGLDYYWDRCPKNVQQKVFIEQLNLAKQLNLPVIIHNRNAWQDTLSILKQMPDFIPGVFHCFSGDKNQLKRVLDLGFFVSFTGVVTFKNSSALELVAKYVPLEKLLLETDSPFMAPVPHRGKRCEPAFTRFIAEKIAVARKLSIKELAKATNENVLKLFNIDIPVPK